ncbi:MAG: UDP-4-amino-4,6-dideoxy-N-acetyl-beta-L-altrosamine N-acetyltransferase [Pseudomonadales bacterium]
MTLMVSGKQSIRLMAIQDLELVLAWRNHKEIRRYMYTQHEITLAEHSAWFDRVSQDSSRHLLIFEDDKVPLGFVSIHQIGSGEIGDWGFYADPAAPKGTGRKLGQLALKFAFTHAKLHKICGQSLRHNSRSIKFHLHLGFKQEGILREQHYDGQRYHDIVCFGLLAADWNINTLEV